MSHDGATTNNALCAREFSGDFESITSKLLDLANNLSVPSTDKKVPQPQQSILLNICQQHLIGLSASVDVVGSPNASDDDDDDCTLHFPPMKRARISEDGDDNDNDDDDDVTPLDLHKDDNDATQEVTKTKTLPFPSPKAPVPSPNANVAPAIKSVTAELAIQVAFVQPPVELAPAQAVEPPQAGIVQPPVELDLPPVIEMRTQLVEDINTAKGYYIFEYGNTYGNTYGSIAAYDRLSAYEKDEWKTAWKKQRTKYSNEKNKGMYAYLSK